MEDINGFEWDSEKALHNQQKHGVSFIEAVSVFYDNNAMLIPDHSSGEERFLLLGRSNKDNLLVVVHCREKYLHSDYLSTFGNKTRKWTI